MKYGIYLPNFGPYGDLKVLSELARDAEESGWDGFFFWDHIAGWNLPLVDVWVALTAVAMGTESIRIGITVTPLPRRRPWKVARETVSIDRISGGRLSLGVGTGLGAEEWDHLGEQTNPKIRGAMLDEALDILVGLWRGEPFNYSGKHYGPVKAHFLPTPIQQPRIPIWVGGFWPNPAPFRRAAKWDGVFPLFQVDSDEQELAQFKDMVETVLNYRRNDTPMDFIAMGITPGDQPDQADDMVRQRSLAGATWWLELIAPYRFGVDFDGEWPVDALRERVQQGPPNID
jgi:alkanesulfonate monooxygenase SsuD/methylene tetrahydromethanopterin reductase-like flavin-dependent oxidoreductase (luciferase family)